jgi:hypothetical protein
MEKIQSIRKSMDNQVVIFTHEKMGNNLFSFVIKEERLQQHNLQDLR